ncbi:hypothetical protein QYM36_003272 [Artemia franciscana]|uniref:Uncharacterized protein n=1 Tax=Artemia franciscana TaxID=6661 RepID=A0AA88IJU3_ARTSF|nr:hypothetical protein QYM36_003272 [Artemia franciscana]
MSSIRQKMFDDRMKALEKKLDLIISKQIKFAITLSSISDEVQILKNESKSRDSKIVILENQLEEQKSRCDTIEAKILEMEVKDRKLNLIIHGLSKEKQQQTVFADVSTLFSSTMEITDNVQILQRYRMSQKSNVSTRKPTAPPVFLSVSSEKDIQCIFRSISKLKGTGFRICTDLPTKLNTVRNGLLAKGKELRDNGSVQFTRLKQKGAKLWFEYKSDSESQWEKA